MKRNVIEMGGKSYVVSLPARWVKKYGIKKGDELDVVEDGEKVVVSSGKSTPKKSIKIDVSNLNPILINKIIYAIYVRGADKIHVTFSNGKEAQLIKEAAKTMIGCTITEESRNSMHISDVHGPPTDFEPIMRRVFFMLNSMIKDGIEGLKSKKKEFLIELKNKDYEIGDAVNFCLRYLNKRGHYNVQKTTVIYTTLRNVENLGDEFYWLFKFIAESKDKQEKQIFEIIELIASLFQQYSELVYQFDRDKLSKFITLKEKLDLKMEALSKKRLQTGNKIIGPLWAIITRTFDLIEPTLEEQY